MCHCGDRVVDVLLGVGDGVGTGASSQRSSECVFGGGDGVDMGDGSHQISDVVELGVLWSGGNIEMGHVLIRWA